MSTSPLRRRSPRRGGSDRLDASFGHVPGANLPGPETLLRLFRDMVLLRRFESAAQVACRTGETPGFLHLYIGEEAVAVGVCAHLRRDRLGHLDPSRPRPCASQGRGARRVMAELFGKADGMLRRPRRHHASLRAGGRAVRHQRHRRGRHRPGGWRRLGARAQGRDDVAVAFFGDGAANHGGFHEALNFAAVTRAPAVFVCENNLYATATPLSTVTLNPEIASRAAAYGMPGVAVDGNDVFAVWLASRRGGRAGPPRRRADADRGQDLSHCRPP